ncbi:hypothetical protein [Bradyrhizobium sp.]|jgi:hypothetical protein|uniref:hypothetical protein n=1 Tax=Bradyrhizobium sp. TaxID=376 RepID=UPI003BAF0523
MPGKIDDLLPDAGELQRRAKFEKAKKVDEYVDLLAEAELEKRALIESLGKKKPGIFEERTVKLASAIIKRAAQGGNTEVQVYRFSNLLCTDGGLAISQNAAGWEDTLAGAPQEIYRLWSDYLQPRGYQIRYVMLELPASFPENISIVVSWGDDRLWRRS